MTIPSLFKSVRIQFFLGLLFSLADLWIWGKESNLSNSDWGTWIGSVGTVGALIGTIVIASDERKARKKRELALAKISATSFNVRLGELLVAVSGAVTLANAFDAGGVIENLELAEKLIIEANIWAPAEVIDLVGYDPELASDLARFASTFAALQARLSSPNKAASMGIALGSAIMLLEKPACEDLIGEL